MEFLLSIREVMVNAVLLSSLRWDYLVHKNHVQVICSYLMRNAIKVLSRIISVLPTHGCGPEFGEDGKFVSLQGLKDSGDVRVGAIQIREIPEVKV